MFTGIIEEIGKVKAVRRGSDVSKMVIQARKVLGQENSLSGVTDAGGRTKIGDSISVNGVCLTVTEMDSSSFTADVMPETLARTGFAELRPGSSVNLERAMPADGRFGGHIVSGHIDGTGKIASIRRDGNAVWFRIDTEPEIVKFIVEKGSIAIDGISLTVAEVDAQGFSVSIIPHTLKETALGEKNTGDTVNLENDIVGKYIAKLSGRE